MVSQSVPDLKPNTTTEPETLAVLKIQRCQKYWTAPRMRARHYDPVHPNGSKIKTGSTRLPGYELSTREGIALHYLLENGRLADLIRSLEQLKEKGATLTERTYLPLLGHAKRLNEPNLSCALIVHAEKADAWITARSYDEAVEAQTDAKEVDLAEAILAKCLKQGY